MKDSNILNYSVFGQYSQGENRVTAALLHILRIGGENLINDILKSYTNDASLPCSEILVETQVGDNDSVPDGKLSCNFNFNIYIESKIVCKSINPDQLKNHRKKILNENDYLIYITPDTEKPTELSTREIWFNWKTIYEILNNYSDGCNDDILHFLIKQFQLLIDNMKLVNYSDNRVIVVGGSFGEEVAVKYNFYACQNNRFFSPAKYLAFAHNNRIKYLFEIEGIPENNVLLSDKNIDISYYENYEKMDNSKRKYFKLKRVMDFKNIIENDNKDKNGRRCAYTQSQRYTTYEKFITAKFTSEL